ncbi:TPA: hypothetical protein DIT45_00025 [Candidatus Acetothermia bacterium]|nr:hypothetical protein [Candidatus Acetothermia bacterium]
MVTIKDIAREVGVSPSTVSRALSDSPLISEKTKRRVIKIAQKLGYKRNELARGLVKGLSGAVGLLVADITNPFFADIARRVGKVAHHYGYGVILCNTADEAERESSYIRLLRRKRVDGLILTSVTMDDPDLGNLAQTKTPFILVSCHSIDAPFVVIADREGARLAVEHLVKLGHKQIRFIGGPRDIQSSRDRRGYGYCTGRDTRRG